jgi:myo-inositol-1(or 4)-monophosphatase
MNDYLQLCIQAATTAGRHAMNNLDRRQAVHKSFKHDIKLELDRECQTIAEDVIRSTFPGHAILGEEGVLGGEKGQPEWIIDPIDGTVNFFHGLPLWCCSVAVREKGRVLAGAVYAPRLEELYTASFDGPAQLNHANIEPSKTAKLNEAILCTGLSTKDEEGAWKVNQLASVTQLVRKIRIMGSAALDICHVAAGRIDCYCEYSIYIWDIAAADLILRQAGGLSARRPHDEQGTRMQYVGITPYLENDIDGLFRELNVPSDFSGGTATRTV